MKKLFDLCQFKHMQSIYITNEFITMSGMLKIL